MNVKGTEEIPLEWGGKLVFINSIVGGSIDARFMPAILKGIMSRMEQGPLTGSYARDVRVIVYDGKIIGRGYNRRNTDKTTLGHAEITAIKKASRYMQDWRLEGCTLYVTLEPCQMCAGAIIQARIPRVVIGSMNSKAGCAGSVLNILQMPQFNHQAEVVRGVCEEQCSTMLSSFFKELREKKKILKEKALAESSDADNNQ